MAAGAQLSIQQVEVPQKTWPHARKAYVNVIGTSGSPIQGLPPDTFKVYETGNKDSSKIEKVDSLEAAQSGASIVIVVQASGAMMGIQEDLKKAVAAFVNGLGEKDQVAVVDYAEAAETVSPFSEDKWRSGRQGLGKITFTGKSYLLYDGLGQALSLYSAPTVAPPRAPRRPLKAACSHRRRRSSSSPSGARQRQRHRRRDDHLRTPTSGASPSTPSATSSWAAIQTSLANLEMIAKRTNGTYKAATLRSTTSTRP